MRITTRLSLISVGTLAALAALMLVLGDSFLEFRKARIDFALANDLRASYFERVYYRDQYYLYREERAQASWFQRKEAADQTLRQAAARFHEEADRRGIERIQVLMDESARIFQRIVDTTTLLKRNAEQREIYEELDKRLYSQLLLKGSAVHDAVRDLQESFSRRLERAFRRLAVFTGLVAVSLILIILLTLTQIIRLLKTRLLPLHDGVQAIADGDFGHRMDTRGSDEFSELAQSINAMAGQLGDFTQRLEAEAGARREVEVLRASERKLSEILEGVDALIHLKDTRGCYLFANRPARDFLGAPMDGIVGQTDAAFFRGEELARRQDIEHRVLREGVPVRLEESFTRNGETLTHWSVHLPLRNEQGKIYGLCGVATDLTERKHLEAQLQQVQKMESLGSLASGVAHDINNVLGAILGLSSAHLERHPAGSPTHRAFDTIVKAAQRGGDLVKSLLTFARRTTAEDLELDLNEVIREEVRLLEHTTLAQVRLEMDLAPDLKRMRRDASALSHALMNLCVNAVDAMDGKGTLRFRTRNLESGDIDLEVEDTGKGMSADVLAKAFDPFFTTKELGKGTGLGLPMVYSAVKAHHGQIEIHSSPGQGTRISIQFPGVGGIAPLPRPQGEAASEAHQLPLEVLVVDDDELLQEALSIMLEALGHRMHTATSGEAALDLLASGTRPDAVILDLNMPGMGGAAALPRIRALCPQATILLSTGRTDQTALDLLRAHPGVGLLPKPFGTEALKQRLNQVQRS